MIRATEDNPIGIFTSIEGKAQLAQLVFNYLFQNLNDLSMNDWVNLAISYNSVNSSQFLQYFCDRQIAKNLALTKGVREGLYLQSKYGLRKFLGWAEAQSRLRYYLELKRKYQLNQSNHSFQSPFIVLSQQWESLYRDLQQKEMCQLKLDFAMTENQLNEVLFWALIQLYSDALYWNFQIGKYFEYNRVLGKILPLIIGQFNKMWRRNVVNFSSCLLAPDLAKNVYGRALNRLNLTYPLSQYFSPVKSGSIVSRINEKFQNESLDKLWDLFLFLYLVLEGSPNPPGKLRSLYCAFLERLLEHKTQERLLEHKTQGYQFFQERGFSLQECLTIFVAPTEDLIDYREKIG